MSHYWGEPERAPHVQVVQRARLYIYVRVASRNRTLAHIRRFEKMADEVARPKIVFTGLPEGYQTSFWAEDFGIFIISSIAAKKDDPKCPLVPI